MDQARAEIEPLIEAYKYTDAVAAIENAYTRFALSGEDRQILYAKIEETKLHAAKERAAANAEAESKAKVTKK